MVWKSVLGGVIGGITGGPIGAAIGASIGAGIEHDEANSYPELPKLESQLRYITDQDGALLIVKSPTLQQGNIVIIHSRTDDSGYREANSSHYADNDGHFSLPISYENGCAKVYMPFGSILPNSDDKLLLSVRGFHTEEDNSTILIGEDIFTIDWKDHTYIETRRFRPLIGLCMTVARANGILSKK